MWNNGVITDGEDVYIYFIKHFNEGSRFGINEGKISKLEIKRNNTMVVLYDRGWIIRPITKVETAIYNMIIELYN